MTRSSFQNKQKIQHTKGFVFFFGGRGWKAHSWVSVICESFAVTEQKICCLMAEKNVQGHDTDFYG